MLEHLPRPALLIVAVALLGAAQAPACCATVPADPSVFADQLAIMTRITSARFDEEVTQPQPKGEQLRFGIHYLMKGGRFRVGECERPEQDRRAEGQAYVANAGGWQYREGRRDLFLMHKGPGYDDFTELPYCGFMHCPLPLKPFSYLAYHDHSATSSLTLAWDQLLDKKWLADHLKASLATMEQETGGDIIVHVPQKSTKVANATEFIEEIQDVEARYVLALHPEFGGVRLVSEIRHCLLGKPPVTRAVITYRAVPAADGSGTFPVPVALIESDCTSGKVIAAQKVTAVTLNQALDDSEFEIDPTEVQRINDFTPFDTLVTVPTDSAGGAQPEGK
jgi:hypothetical protein